MALSDLHVFALTRDGRASEIPTRWRPAPDVSTRLSVDGAELPVVAGAVTGSVDFASIEAHAITTFVLPDGLRLPDEAGLEMEIDSTDGGRIEISDSFTPGGRVPATSEPAADHMALAVRAHTSGPLRVFLDSCPQWYAFRGQLLHLRHPPGVRIRSVRVLQRAAGTGM